MRGESADAVTSEVLRAIGATRPPEPGVLADAREALWSMIASEMLGAGSESAASRGAAAGEGGRATTRRREAGRTPDEHKRALGGGD